MECQNRARKTSLPARFEHFNLDDDSTDALDVAAGECSSNATLQNEAQDASITQASVPTMHRATRGRKFPCQKCGRCFDSRLKRTKHQFTHTGAASSTSSLECTKCQRTFSSRLTLVEHQAWHESRMLYSCPTCNRQFRQNTGLWRHLRTHDPDAPKRRYPCAQCGKDFARLDYLKEHLASHDESRKGRFVCDICQRSFFQSSDLSRHRQTHNSERRFECSICKRGFLNSSSLKRHEKEHDPAQRTPCPECGATFKRPCQLKDHIVRYHGDAALLKLLAPKKRLIQSASALKMDRKQTSKPLLQHDDNSVLQRNGHDTIGGVQSRLEAEKDCLLRERLTARVDVVPASDLQICDRPEMNGNTSWLPEQHTSSGKTMASGSSSAPLGDGSTQSEKPTKQTPTAVVSNPAGSPTLQGNGCAETEAVDQGDILQRSLRVLPIECIEGDLSSGLGIEPETSFVSHPDFGSQAYYDWLSGFTSACNLATLPLDTEMFTKVTQVLKTISDALATPSGVLTCRENFRVLLGILEDLQRAVGSHLNFVLETLQPSQPT
ncbi:uncharacterized protein [Dermacentor andersoni]|uniref:uncharacterized protein isoform X1 n=2 Tax=Dermacentor andersoni TaxID=34620 RepID=UPI002155A5ED|nr:GDNF-inducible zinc finger protein 1-like [Dermacentor andersoni]